MKYSDKVDHLNKGECLFCRDDSTDFVLENDLAFVLWDNFPVSPSHCLVIPKRHVETYFDMNAQEHEASKELLFKMRDKIQRDDPSVKGFNIGANCGPYAGQTIFHCHLHLIPRRKDDIPNPVGGVRNIFPESGPYPVLAD